MLKDVACGGEKATLQSGSGAVPCGAPPRLSRQSVATPCASNRTRSSSATGALTGSMPSPYDDGFAFAGPLDGGQSESQAFRATYAALKDRATLGGLVKQSPGCSDIVGKKPAQAWDLRRLSSALASGARKPRVASETRYLVVERGVLIGPLCPAGRSGEFPDRAFQISSPRLSAMSCAMPLVRVLAMIDAR